MIAELQEELERRADPAKKTWWENYVKGGAFRGTPMGEIRKAVDAFVSEHPELTEGELKALACELIAQALAEDKLAVVLLFSEHQPPARQQHAPRHRGRPTHQRRAASRTALSAAGEGPPRPSPRHFR